MVQKAMIIMIFAAGTKKPSHMPSVAENHTLEASGQSAMDEQQGINRTAPLVWHSNSTPSQRQRIIMIFQWISPPFGGTKKLQTHPLCSLGTPTGEAPFYRPMGVSQPIRNVMSLADQGWALRFCGRLIFGVKWSVKDSNWKKRRKPNANRKEANPHSLWNDFQYLWTVTAIKTRLPPATWSTTDGLQFYNVHQFGCFGNAQQNDWRRSLSKRPSRTAEISSTGGTSWARNNSDHHLGNQFHCALKSPVSTIVLEIIINGFVWKKCVSWIQWWIIMIPVFCIAIIGNRFHFQTHKYIYIYIRIYIYITQVLCLYHPDPYF